jgi:RNA polymerase sigma factor (sigma-70 family)
MDGDRYDDAELVAAVLAGDREAFSPLLARWQPSVLGLCRRLLGPGPQAEDVAQEAAVHAFLGLPRLADPVRFGAWLHAIAANRARVALRRRRLLALERPPLDATVGLRAGEPVPTPEDAWAVQEVHQAILAALRELPPATREAVIGFYLQGYSYRELAELLGAPLSTIRGRLYHGRRQLRRTLRPLAEEMLTPAPTRREEHGMDTTALIDVDVAFVGRLAFSTDCVVMLHEQGGTCGLDACRSEGATLGMLRAQVSLVWPTSPVQDQHEEQVMPAISADTVALPRILEPSLAAVDRPVVSVTTAPSGFEGEGFPVRRAFAGVDLRTLDPFVHMDQMGEVDYAPGEPKGTPWHPHRGFETVTYMLDGMLRHQDSNDGGGLITDGDTQWMTAG